MTRDAEANPGRDDAEGRFEAVARHTAEGHASLIERDETLVVTAMGESLYDYLEQVGKPVVRATQRFNAAVVTEELAHLLAIPVGEQMLLVSRLAYTHKDKPIEFNRSYCINEYYDFVVEMRR